MKDNLTPAQVELYTNTAYKILGNVSERTKNEVEFKDIITILMVIYLVLSIIKVLRNCEQEYGSQQTFTNVKKPNNGQIRIVERELKRVFGIRAYQRYGRELIQATIKYGVDISPQEYRFLLDSIN